MGRRAQLAYAALQQQVAKDLQRELEDEEQMGKKISFETTMQAAYSASQLAVDTST
jgi:hypothetical protein